MSTYDDKIDELLISRKRRAEERKAIRRKQCMMQITYICIALCVLILLVVGIKKLAGGKSADDTEVTTPITISTEDSSSTATINTDDSDDNADNGDSDETDITQESETDFTGKTVYCIDNVNLRAESNTEATVITVVSAGESVEVEEQGKEWCKVKYGKKEGYLKLEYLAETYEQQ